MGLKRFLASIVDFIIAMLIGELFILLSFMCSYFSIIAFSVMFSFIVYKDNCNGQSIGKHIFKLQVVDNETKQTTTQIKYILRNMFLIIWPIELLLLIINNKRLGDYVTKTKVINNELLQFRVNKNNILIFIFLLIVVTLLTVLVLKSSIVISPKLKLLF